MVYNKIKKEGAYVENMKTIASIKRNIEDHVGDKVTLKANGGRKKVVINNGIIESAHPSIFVVRLDNDNQRTVSYSYSDVLTKTVQLDFSL
nr:Veg family protein [Caproiciproducens sp. MSJ-32]